MTPTMHIPSENYYKNYFYNGMDLEKRLRHDNVRMCLCLGWFHMLSINDLENEVKRLEGRGTPLQPGGMGDFVPYINRIKEYLNRGKHGT